MTLTEAVTLPSPFSATHQYKPSSSLLIFFNIRGDAGGKFLASLPDLVHVTLGIGMPVVLQLIFTSSLSINVTVWFFGMPTIPGRSARKKKQTKQQTIKKMKTENIIVLQTLKKRSKLHLPHECESIEAGITCEFIYVQLKQILKRHKQKMNPMTTSDYLKPQYFCLFVYPCKSLLWSSPCYVHAPKLSHDFMLRS